jgi:hypothetical protein
MSEKVRRKTTPATSQDATLVGQILKRSLCEGNPIELEGLGVFLPGTNEPAHFLADNSAHVFIAYAAEDRALANRLYNDLADAGMSPWMDRHKLLPGQQWSKCIERAIETADFFVACFSTTSSVKRGHFPYEIRCALRCAERMPLDDEFLMPVRLDDCKLPRIITAQTHHVDLFPDWDKGVTRLINSICAEMQARRSRRAA